MGKGSVYSLADVCVYAPSLGSMLISLQCIGLCSSTFFFLICSRWWLYGTVPIPKKCVMTWGCGVNVL